MFLHNRKTCNKKGKWISTCLWLWHYRPPKSDKLFLFLFPLSCIVLRQVSTISNCKNSKTNSWETLGPPSVPVRNWMHTQNWHAGMRQLSVVFTTAFVYFGYKVLNLGGELSSRCPHLQFPSDMIMPLERSWDWEVLYLAQVVGKKYSKVAQELINVRYRPNFAICSPVIQYRI